MGNKSSHEQQRESKQKRSLQKREKSTAESQGEESELEHSHSSSIPPSPSSQEPSTPTKKQSGEDVISNWKLFNDLENREESEVLELSVFLDTLSAHMPEVHEKKKAQASASDNSGSDSDSDANDPTSQSLVGQIDISDMYHQTSDLDAQITLQNAEDLIESCRQGRKIPRHVVVRVLREITPILSKISTLVEYKIEANHITVIGDLHGQLDDLLLIFRENGLPSESNPYLFNGDIVDRGDRGVELMVIVYLFKLLYPDHVLINRGNHEDFSITQVFGFMKECETKYDIEVYELFCQSFQWLPLATLLDQRVLVLHGGIGRDCIDLHELNQMDRTEYDLSRYRSKISKRDHKEAWRRMNLMRDLLWSDPQRARGWTENARGAGITYGPDLVHKFMHKNKLALIVRSHECVPKGFHWPYGDKGMLVTLFSASNYCGKANNLGCFMRIPSDKSSKPAFFQYMASVEARDMAVSNLDGLFSLILETRDDLEEEFVKCDTELTGKVTLQQWCDILEASLDLSLDWRALQPLLTVLDDEGKVSYAEFLNRYNAQGQRDPALSEEEHMQRRRAFNSLYRHRSRLEALFRMLDHDGDGTVTLEDLEMAVKMLNEKLPSEAQQELPSPATLMKMMDFGRDNKIDINEFMEGFRLNAKLTAHAKWKRARKKIKALSLMGALKFTNTAEEEEEEEEEEEKPPLSPQLKALTRVKSMEQSPKYTKHGSVLVIEGAATADPEDVDVQVEDTFEDDLKD